MTPNGILLSQCLAQPSSGKLLAVYGTNRKTQSWTMHQVKSPHEGSEVNAEEEAEVLGGSKQTEAPDTRTVHM